MKHKHVFINNESVLQSWLKDGFTFGGIFLLSLLNHRLLDGSTFIDILCVFFVLTGLFAFFGKSNGIYLTTEEAIEYFADLEKEGD